MAIKIRAREVQNIRQDIKERKERREKADSAPRFATWIPHEDQGDLNIRFLANPDNGGWLAFDQFYVPGKGGIIATEENYDEYLELTGKYPAQRFYAPALDISRNEVVVVEIPGSMIDTLIALADRMGKPEGDITSFDLTLFKTGKGTDTKYQAIPSGVAQMDLSSYTLPNLMATLEAKVAYQEGRDTREDKSDQIEDEKVSTQEEPPFEPDEPKPVRKRTIKRSR